MMELFSISTRPYKPIYSAFAILKILWEAKKEWFFLGLFLHYEIQKRCRKIY